ncbi:MAG: hypothetical protein ACTSXH_00800 [Promethearchaeota archaeon]
MGSIFEGRCKCGYNVRVNVGGTMMNFREVSYLPALCSTCKEIISFNIYQKPYKCPKCGNKMDIEEYADLEEGEGKNKSYYCPKCGKHSLKFSLSVLYD